MSKFHAVGIDLGTTYSVVARLDDADKSQIVRNFHGDILTPSVVLFDDKEIIVGKEAKKAAATDADRVAECVKRDMGSEFFSKPIRGEMLPPEVIQACILRKPADAVRVCGNDIKVVITVPAYFDEPRRKATSDAGMMAGLDVLDIVNEPTAAALSYGEHLGYLDPKGSPKGDMKVLVYDLGGGTFDVTVIEFKPGHIRTLATDGDVRLGGQDWDARLADYLAEKFIAQGGGDPRQSPVGSTRLMRAVEEAKHTLTARTVASVHFDHNGKSLDLEVTRDKFEELTEDLLERTAYTTRQVLQAAKTQWQYISHILLVGGSTRMPMVSKLLEKASGMKPEHVVNPDEAVARGAAIYAGYLLATRELTPKPVATPYKVTDVNAHSLGIEGIDQQTFRRENFILIPRNTPLPFRAEEKFVTKAAGQQSIVVQVLEGESKTPEQCSKIVRAVMRQLPQGLPQGYPIEVSYEYGANGRLSVRAKVPGTKQDLRIELERERGMNDERLARWKRVVAAEKGFDAFEAVLEQVLQIEGMQDEPKSAPAPRPAAQPFREGGAAIETKPQGAGPASPTVSPATIKAATAPGLQASVAPNPPFQTVHGKQNMGTPAAASSPPPFQSPAQAAASHASAQQNINPVPMRTTAKASTSSMIVTLAGHIFGSVLGLVLGYYILCWISPEANFLNLQLPGLPPPPAAPSNLPQPLK